MLEEVDFKTPKKEFPMLYSDNHATRKKNKHFYRFKTQSTMDSLGSQNIVHTFEEEDFPKTSPFEIDLEDTIPESITADFIALMDKVNLNSDNDPRKR